MVDESTNISNTEHLVMFATIVEKDLPKTVFLGLLQFDGSKNILLQFFIARYLTCDYGI